jgi:tripartite-type tricarboxylate transporter receptor subunit TctC
MIAVTSSQRLPQFPDLPTVGESSPVAGFTFTYWWGLYGPAGLSDEVLGKLFTASQAALSSPTVQKVVGEQPGYLISPSVSPREFAQWAEAEGLLLRDLTARLGLAGQ